MAKTLAVYRKAIREVGDIEFRGNHARLVEVLNDDGDTAEVQLLDHFGRRVSVDANDLEVIPKGFFKEK